MRTNDPAQPNVRLSLRARVVPDLLVEPRYVDFGRVEVGATPSREIAVRLRDGLRGRITAVDVRDHAVRATILARRGGDDGARIRVKLTDAAAPGALHSALLIRTDVPEAAPQHVPVVGRIVEPGEAGPATPSRAVRAQSRVRRALSK